MIQLEPKTNQQRKAYFLKPIVIGVIILLTIAFVIMFIPPMSKRLWFIIVGSSILLNLVVLYLNQRGFIEFAAHLFCHTLNIFLLLLFLHNLFIDKEVTYIILSTYLFALTVMLAGILISPQATFKFAAFNTILLLMSFSIADDTQIKAIDISFPIGGFLFLVALISWLYQKTMNQAYAQLNTTQQQLMNTQLVHRDLEIARDLQQRLYPPPPRTEDHLTIACRSKPAQETSGDLYDFIQLSPHEWGIVVADVTGKSLPAALVMAMTRSTLRSEAHRFTSPSMLLRRANQVLYQDDSVDQMITALYGILDTRALTFHFANAGHVYPILKHKTGVREVELNGLPLKAMSRVHYQERAVQLEPGDQLILSSDGVAETMNHDKELFGFERLSQTIDQIDYYATPHEILNEIWQSVETFRDEAEQLDDITLVVIGVDPMAQDKLRAAEPQLEMRE
jgi:serine phosphatase RsbU (regulator of sigma subunit)